MSTRSPILAGAAAALALLLAHQAGASIPTGERYGAWHVLSITSLSGDGSAADASARLLQENSAGELSADWVQGGSVLISAKILSCYGEDEDFYRSRSIPAADWRALGRGEAVGRLEADFRAWLREARAACRKAGRIGKFRMARLRAAAKDFAARQRYLSGGD